MTVQDEILGVLSSLPPDKQQLTLAFAKSLISDGTKKPLRSPAGLWAGTSLDLTYEEIEKARSEAWSPFPREF